MNKNIHFFLLILILCTSVQGKCQDTNSVELHFQVFDKGICMPMARSEYYNASRFYDSKAIFKSSAYYSTMHIYLDSKDSAELLPMVNHMTQSSSIRLNPNLKYRLVLLNTNGFFRTEQDSMVIDINKLSDDSQVELTFKKGKFSLDDFESFRKLNKNEVPDFSSEEEVNYKRKLKLDSTTYYENGKVQAKYFNIYKGYPLCFVQEFDSVNPQIYSQGCRLSPFTNDQSTGRYSVWSNDNTTKYGYWEYFENGIRTKHEYWASVLTNQYEWYNSGKLKSCTNYARANKENMHEFYHENGKLKESFFMGSRNQQSELKRYSYSPEWKLIMITSYNSATGKTTQGVQKRKIFYPSGQLKMEENFISTYSIKYYNEDGTEYKM